MGISFTRGALYVLAAVMLWGAQLPLAKSAFAALDTPFVNLARYGIAVVILVPLLVAREGRRALSYEGRFARTWLVGAVGMAGSAMLVFLGLSYTLPENTVVILALQPSLAALAHWRLHGQRPPRATLACIGFAFAGVVMVVTHGEPRIALGPKELLGDVLILLGAMCWVFYTLAAASFGGWSSLRFTTLTMLPAVALMLAVAIAGLGLGRIAPPDAAAALGVAPQVAYLAFAGVVLANLLWNRGNQRIGGLNAALLLNLMPVVTFAFRFLQGQRFLPIEIAGAVLVVVALVANNLFARRGAARAAIPVPQPEP